MGIIVINGIMRMTVSGILYINIFNVSTMLFQLSEEVDKVCGMITSCLNGNPDHTRLHLPELLKYILLLLRSPLTAPKMVAMYKSLSRTAFTDKDPYFG